ncbi:MAG: hypothetical protein AAFV25_16305, partial [Bacteroidota bacterium]
MNKTVLYYLLTISLLLGLYLEVGMQTFDINRYGPYTSPIVWLAGGLLFCLSAFGMMRLRPAVLKSDVKTSFPIPSAALSYGLLAFGTYYIGQQLAPIFAQNPSDPNASDILPSLELYVRRWLGGEVVYKAMDFGGWTVNPTYFPLLWMPYAISELLQIDYRWTSYGVFILAIILYNAVLLRQRRPLPEILLKSAIPFFLLQYFLDFRPKVFIFSVELLPVGFYLILTLTTWHRKNWVMAIGILLCLLSRYAFTFWLPVYLLILWIERGFFPTLRTGLWVSLGVLLLYVLPFLSKDWSILGNGLKYYAKTAEGQWYPQPWQKEGDVPFHLNQGLSFAMQFYSKTDYTIPDRLASNRKV